MSENQENYEIKASEMAVNISATVYLEQIAKLSQLQLQTGLNKSEVIRAAINLYYDSLQPSRVVPDNGHES